MNRVERDLTERLVSEVEKRPVLYAQDHPEYKNRFQIEKEWATIAAVLNSTADAAKKRWQNLRGSFTKNLSAMRNSGIGIGPPGGATSNSSNLKGYSKFYLHDQMQFLTPYLNPSITGFDNLNNHSNEYYYSNNNNTTGGSSYGHQVALGLGSHLDGDVARLTGSHHNDNNDDDDDDGCGGGGGDYWGERRSSPALALSSPSAPSFTTTATAMSSSSNNNNIMNGNHFTSPSSFSSTPGHNNNNSSSNAFSATSATPTSSSPHSLNGNANANQRKRKRFREKMIKIKEEVALGGGVVGGAYYSGGHEWEDRDDVNKQQQFWGGDNNAEAGSSLSPGVSFMNNNNTNNDTNNNSSGGGGGNGNVRRSGGSSSGGGGGVNANAVKVEDEDMLNPDLSFFKGLVPMMKELPSKRKLSFFSKVIKLLQQEVEMAEKEEEDGAAGVSVSFG